MLGPAGGTSCVVCATSTDFTRMTSADRESPFPAGARTATAMATSARPTGKRTSRSYCGAGSVSPERPGLDGPHLRKRMRSGDLDGLVEAVALEDVEPADRLLRLDERAVRHELPAVAHANRAGAPRRRELVARHPDPTRLHVVEPREALLALLRLLRLGLRVHVLGVPADQHHVLHRCSSSSIDVVVPGRRTSRTRIDIFDGRRWSWTRTNGSGRGRGRL